MNNTNNEIKNTLYGTKSRKREAEDRISEVEDRMAEINEEEIGKPPEKEFRVMIVKMFQSLENRVEKMQAPINAMNMALDKIETNNTITKIKNTLEETNSIISEAEE